MGVNLPVTLAMVRVAGTPPVPFPEPRVTQPSVRLVDSDPAELAVDAIVIGLPSQPDDGGALLPAAGAESITAAFDERLTTTLALLGATGAAGEVTKLATLGTISAPL